MPNLQALDAERRGRPAAADGEAAPGLVRARTEVGVPSPACDVPEAPGSGRADGGSAAKVARRSGATTGKRLPRLNAALFAMALEELMSGPTTRSELIERTGLGIKTVQSIVWALHKRRMVHIASWEKDTLGRFRRPAYRFGTGRDAPKPPPKTGAELARGYKERRARRLALLASAGASMQEAA